MSEVLRNELPYHLPVPVSQFYSRSLGRCLNRSLQPGLLLFIEEGGQPPVCTKLMPSGPSRRKSTTHSPIVYEGLSKTSATCIAVQPRDNNQIACHRSRSLAVGARYIRSCTARLSKFHCCIRFLISLTAQPPHTHIPQLTIPVLRVSSWLYLENPTQLGRRSN